MKKRKTGRWVKEIPARHASGTIRITMEEDGTIVVITFLDTYENVVSTTFPAGISSNKLRTELCAIVAEVRSQVDILDTKRGNEPVNIIEDLNFDEADKDWCSINAKERDTSR